MFNTTFFKELLLRNKQETKFKKNCEHYLIKRIPSQLEQETKLGGGAGGHYCAVTNSWEFMPKKMLKETH